MKIKNYTSEFTKFIEEMKKNNPDVEKNQQAGRNLLWDKKPINLDETKRDNDSKLKQSSYVYHNK